jgi:phosphate transport system ATP-binding protein
VLKGINLNVSGGEVLALIGPAHSGKSTFLRTLNRMYQPGGQLTAGSVRLNGEDIYSPQCDVVQLRKRVGMIFPKANPFPMSIFANVAYGPRIHGLHDRREIARIVEESLKQVGLWEEVRDDLGRSALQLASGQQQRLCIARVLALPSEVLLLD